MRAQPDVSTYSIPAPMSPRLALWRLCRSVGAVVAAAPPRDVPRRVAALRPGILAVPGLLTPEQMTAPPDGYGRNRVFLCPRDTFSILAMVWPAGVATPVHDHRDWCAFGVYQGMIEEARYEPVDASPECTRAVERKIQSHRAGAAAHLPVGAPNIHRICNPTGDAAVSIHVYGGNCETRGPNLDRIYTVEP